MLPASQLRMDLLIVWTELLYPVSENANNIAFTASYFRLFLLWESLYIWLIRTERRNYF